MTIRDENVKSGESLLHVGHDRCPVCELVDLITEVRYGLRRKPAA
jgi:hypothetical protein